MSKEEGACVLTQAPSPFLGVNSFCLPTRMKAKTKAFVAKIQIHVLRPKVKARGAVPSINGAILWDVALTLIHTVDHAWCVMSCVISTKMV